MSPDSQTGARSKLPHDATPDVLLLFLVTSTLLLLAESFLSRDTAMTVAAVRLYAVVLLLTGSAALVWRVTRSVEISALFLPAYLVLALWLQTGWLLLPLAVGSIAFAETVDLRGVIKTVRSTEFLIASGVAVALVLCVQHYADFLVMEKLWAGDVKQDILFHTSIASMIKTYGVTSTGLHGLVPLHYHVLSHQLFAALSIMSGVHVLEVYGIAQVVFMCPLLIGAAAWCACRLSKSESTPAAVRHWLFVCAVLIALELLPLQRWVWSDSYFLAGSTALSVIYLLLALPVLAGAGSTLGESAMAGALIMLAGLSKGSTGVIGLAVFWARAIGLPGAIGRRRLAAVALLFTVLFAYLMYDAAEPAAARTVFNPFFLWTLHGKVYAAELRESVTRLMSGHLPPVGVFAKSLAAISSYLLVDFFLAWVVIVRRLVAGGRRAVLGHADSLLCLAAVAVGVASLMFEIIGGWEFIHPATFIALPFLAVTCCRRLAPAPRAVSWAATAAVVVGAAFLVSSSYREKGGIYLKSRESLDLREWKNNVWALLPLRDNDTAGPVVFTRDDAFPDRGDLWSCAQAPFAYPALTERAWVGVIEVNSKCPYAYYGYPAYFTGSPRALVPPVIPTNVPIVRVSAPKRPVPAGEWTTPTFSAGDFTAYGSMTWTVEPGDVTTYAYTVIGKTMIVAFEIGGTSVSGPPSAALQIAIPGGHVAAKALFASFRARDNGTDSVGMAQTAPGGTVIHLYKNASGENWSPSVDTRAAGTITFEIR